MTNLKQARTKLFFLDGHIRYILEDIDYLKEKISIDGIELRFLTVTLVDGEESIVNLNNIVEIQSLKIK